MDDGLAERIRQLEAELDALPEPRTTWFLEPDRDEATRLRSQVALAEASPLIEAILRTGAGAMAVLNQRRQVVALNSGYLQLVGVPEPEGILGLRLGEAVRCVHAKDQLPGGCGTGPACRTCGAAISILVALEQGGPAERSCALTVERDGALVDAEFRVRSQAIEIPPERFILLSLVDVSAERRREALERAFFHEVSSELLGIVGACDAMDGASPEELAIAAADAREIAGGLVQELKLQRCLMAAVPTAYEPAIARIPLGGIVEGLERLARRHPAAAGRRLRVSGNADGALVETDPFLVQRVVANMLVNAFEASPPGGEVALAVEAGVREIAFRVWNRGTIPVGVAPRIFQRYFTTRKEAGRGQGTFVMKHFGEKVLHGRVGFTSTAAAGTTFELVIPRSLLRA